MTLGSQIRDMRISRGMTQTQLGKACGLHQNRVSFIETSFSDVTVRTVERIAAGLGMKVNIRFEEVSPCVSYEQISTLDSSVGFCHESAGRLPAHLQVAPENNLRTQDVQENISKAGRSGSLVVSPSSIDMGSFVAARSAGDVSPLSASVFGFR